MPSVDRLRWPGPGRKKIALVIAGGGSLGSYEAGVLSELVFALESFNAALPAEARFLLDVIAGASAGGVNAALLARQIVTDVSRRVELHDCWVREISMARLLDDDSQPENGLLSKAVLSEIASRHLVDGPL